MYEKQYDNKLIQCLTQYLQYFKTYFSFTISLIEYHIFPEKYNQTNWENLTNKILNKKSSLTFSYPPFQIVIEQKIKSNIDRFYLRLIQFLQYRLSIFKNNEIDQKVALFIENYLKSLSKIFKTFNFESKQQKKPTNKHKTEYKNVGDIFMQIGCLIKKLVHSIFSYLQKNNSKNSLVLDQIHFSKQIFEEHILKHIYDTIAELYEQNRDQNCRTLEQVENGWKIHKKWTDEEEFYHQNYYQNHGNINSTNSEKYLPNFRSINSKSLRQSQLHHQDHFRGYINHGKMFQNLSENQKKQLVIHGQNFSDHTGLNHNLNKNAKKQSYYKQISIMEVQDVQIYSKDYILYQLRNKNAKNSNIISKYIKAYEKRYKKKEKKRQIILQNQQKIQAYQKLQKVQASLKAQKRQKTRITQQKQQQYQNYIIDNKSKSELNVIRPYQLPQVIRPRQRIVSQFNIKIDRTDQNQHISTPIKPISGSSTIVLLNKNRLTNHSYNTYTHQSINLKQQNSSSNHYTYETSNIFLNDDLHCHPLSINIQNNGLNKKDNKMLNIEFHKFNKDTFQYKQKQKQYFQSLKSKLNYQNRNYQDLKRNVYNAKTIEQQVIGNKKAYNEIVQKQYAPSQQEKQALQNIIKHNQNKKYKKQTFKGPNYSSNINANKIKVSRSQLYNAHQNNDKQLTIQQIQGSGINHKKIQMKGKLFKVLQNSQSSKSNMFASFNKLQQRKQGVSIIDSETTVIVLPKIPSVQRNLNTKN